MIILPALVAIGVALGVVTAGDAASSARPLVEPLGFLVVAVPMAMLLDRIGFFDAAAERVAGGRWLRPWLWAFAAVVTTVFNLDAAIVLLTPLFLRVARRHGLDPVGTAFMPVLLASLASSALPVSNLTNLIVAEHLGLRAADFLVRLGPASVAATAVGWLAYRRVVPVGIGPAGAGPGTEPAPVSAADDHAIAIGATAVAVLLVGFTIGDGLGVPPWAVAAAVTAGLAAATRWVPWRSVPVEPVVVALSLAVLVGAAAPHLDLGRVLGGSSAGRQLQAYATGVVGADLVNNLPALLLGLPHLRADDASWAFLLGINTSPVLLVHGSLAGLLWMDIVRRFGHPMTPRRYAAVGCRVGLPAMAAGLVALLATSWLV